MTQSPILFIIFNRPDTTRRVFEAIRQARPSKLFISADGPRAHKAGESEKCAVTRAIVENIDWPCEVKRNYSEKNLGCKIGVSSAINWFFENVEEGIILEDDCLPNQSFFSFADAMLQRYRENEQVMLVRGTNLQFGKSIGDGSYYFSKSPHIWGWATWKRAWKKYDIEMSDLDAFVSSEKIYEIFSDKKIANFWISIFKHVRDGKIDTWDTQWAYTVIKSEGLAVVPNVNLIENIGIGSDATHTTTGPEFLRQTTGSLNEFQAPTKTGPEGASIYQTDPDADNREMQLLYIIPWPQKILAKAKKALDLCISTCFGK